MRVTKNTRSAKGSLRFATAAAASLAILSLSVITAEQVYASPYVSVDDKEDKKEADKQAIAKKSEKLDAMDQMIADLRSKNSDHRNTPLTLTELPLPKKEPMSVLSSSRKQGDLDHLTLSLRSSGSALSAEESTGVALTDSGEGLLSLREAEDPSLKVKSGTFVGLTSISSMFNRSSGFADAPNTGLSASEVELSLGGGRKRDGSYSDGLEIAVQSSYAITDSILGETRQTVGDGLEVRDINLGLRVGYSGFNIDATLLTHDSAFAQDGTGFEAGLSYETGGFAARLSARQYREGLDLLGFENEFRKFVSFELGARYKLNDDLGFTGGVRLFRADDHWMTDPALGEGSQMIYLGGSLRF